ncbi:MULTISPECIES: hypothetical protein [Clostridium]|uniref:Uncharacterized protein n=1 Tax=Clostridium disporicum TaxID=84024 RepID=A0A174DKL5_9CLOT|nr:MULTISPECIES: hypothetical protein [Clostridium]MCD2500475.1 hypothetical protein [Clostridium sp. NSJ-145]CUO25984.1 Uncharacterised protein [Clostridium disporicum]
MEKNYEKFLLDENLINCEKLLEKVILELQEVKDILKKIECMKEKINLETLDDKQTLEIREIELTKSNVIEVNVEIED